MKKKVMKEEDPERILINLISMLSGSSLPSFTFSSSVQGENEEEAEAAGCGWCGRVVRLQTSLLDLSLL